MTGAEGAPGSAPFAEALARAASGRVTSFHTLPAFQGASLAGSPYRRTYEELFGTRLLQIDGSMSSPALDNFFRPRGALAQAQTLAARAFGVDRTFFLTGGTTLANRIALDALDLVGRPVLADRTCHQSIHFPLDQDRAQVTYAARNRCCDKHGREFLDVDDLVDTFGAAARAGNPYRAAVVNGASYDGALVDLSGLISRLAEHVDELTLLIDEGWSAAHRFHPDLVRFTAAHATRQAQLRTPQKRFTVLITQSAHKSLSALRQGSYLHVIGDEGIQDRVGRALYRHHSTSPSLTILASLDLARAQAVGEAGRLMERSVDLVRDLRRRVETDPSLRRYTIGHPLSGPGVVEDPTKCLIEVDPALMSAADLRAALYRDFGIYTSRTAGPGLLVNVNIGVSAAAVDHLVASLASIAAARPRSLRPDLGPSGFVIAYPPGTPVVVPGEEVTSELRQRLADLADEGSEIFFV